MARVEYFDLRRDLHPMPAIAMADKDTRCDQPAISTTVSSLDLERDDSELSTAMHSHAVEFDHLDGGPGLATDLSDDQKLGCFQYIRRRCGDAADFAAHHDAILDRDLRPVSPSASSHWQFAKTKRAVDLYRAPRSRCEVRATTRIHAPLEHVMHLLAATSDSTEAFRRAQTTLLGREHLRDARVLATCMPADPARHFHCGLKYLVITNPFGAGVLDLVLLDYTDTWQTLGERDDQDESSARVGYRVVESIRVPAFQSHPAMGDDRHWSRRHYPYIRASLRCEIYIARESRQQPGVVDVVFAAHLDPKSKLAAHKRHAWQELAIDRLVRLRSFAEQRALASRVVPRAVVGMAAAASLALALPSTSPHARSREGGDARDARCHICHSAFFLLRPRHTCGLCGEFACGRCSHKTRVAALETTKTQTTGATRVRVCTQCRIEARRVPTSSSLQQRHDSELSSWSEATTWIARS